MRAYETSKAPLTIELRQTELNITNLVKQLNLWGNSFLLCLVNESYGGHFLLSY